MIRRVPVPGAGGFRSEEFRAASRASPAIMFICPYGTSISTLRWAVRRLCREGYHVVAYETATAVFMAGVASPHIERTFVVTPDGCRPLTPQDRSGPVQPGAKALGT